MSRVYIIGITGVGKSTFGQTLANVINFNFLDLDEQIAMDNQLSIDDIFMNHGEAGFREREKACLFKTEGIQRTVIACGGGIVELPENRDFLKIQPAVICLERDIEGIVLTIDGSRRPLIKENPGVLYELYRRRKPLYEQVSTVSIDVEALTVALRQAMAHLLEKGLM